MGYVRWIIDHFELSSLALKALSLSLSLSLVCEFCVSFTRDKCVHSASSANIVSQHLLRKSNHRRDVVSTSTVQPRKGEKKKKMIATILYLDVFCKCGQIEASR